MRPSPIRKRPMLLLALCLSPLLTGCGTGPVRFIAPPPERTAPVTAPIIPAASTPCSFDPKQLCNSDAELANVIAAYDDALATANRELAWLRNFFDAVPKKP